MSFRKHHCVTASNHCSYCCVYWVPTFVVVLGVMTRMGPWGKVLVTVRDQRGERVDRMGRLHNGDFVGLRREIQEGFKMTWRSSDITDKLRLRYRRSHFFPARRSEGQSGAPLEIQTNTFWGEKFFEFLSEPTSTPCLAGVSGMNTLYPLRERGNSSQERCTSGP